VAIAQVVEH